MNRIYTVLSLLVGVLGVALFIISYQTESMFMLVIGALMLVLSILLTIFIMTMNLYKKDQEFNPLELSKQGLTLVLCKDCSTENVLEDKFCRKCGEELEE